MSNRCLNILFIFFIIILTPFFSSCVRRVIYDYSLLSPTFVSEVKYPQSLSDLKEIIVSSKKPMSFAGGRYSQGGQIAYPDGIVVDMTQMANIIDFNLEEKTITVQPGVRWRDIQKYIDPYNLSVKVMQSYNDFTVGGSLAVNVHGRDPLGSIIKTVKKIKVMLSDGSLISASRNQNVDLFNAAIGGYGLLGAIVEIELELTQNSKIERRVNVMALENYREFFLENILPNKKVVFHNANIYPNAYNQVLAITWLESDMPLSTSDRLQNKGFYVREKFEEQILRRISRAKKWRQMIEPRRMQSREVVMRNYEMSYSTDALEPLLRFPTTSILQEYFIPIPKLEEFILQLKDIVTRFKVNMLNISIRYVPADNESILAYSPQDSFALVCYINVPRSTSQVKERRWTQALINAALSVGGKYYLPYHLYATGDQFRKAYDNVDRFLAIKKKYDPDTKFRNNLYKKYMMVV